MNLYAEYSDGSESEVTDEATWASSNEHVATVVQGLVTGRNAGGAELRVSYEDLRVRWSFRVVPPPEPWSASGTGSTILDLPTRVTRIRIEGEYNGHVENFSVWCGAPGDRGGLLVNEILGTSSIAIGRRYSGIHSARRSYGGSGQPCRELEIGDAGVKWAITETAPRNSSLSPSASVGNLAGDEEAVARARERVDVDRARSNR